MKDVVNAGKLVGSWSEMDRLISDIVRLHQTCLRPFLMGLMEHFPENVWTSSTWSNLNESRNCIQSFFPINQITRVPPHTAKFSIIFQPPGNVRYAVGCLHSHSVGVNFGLKPLRVCCTDKFDSVIWGWFLVVWISSCWLETFQETCGNYRCCRCLGSRDFGDRCAWFRGSTQSAHRVLPLGIAACEQLTFECFSTLQSDMGLNFSRNEWKWRATASWGSCNSNLSNCHISHLTAKFISLTSFLMAFLQQAMATGRLIRNLKVCPYTSAHVQVQFSWWWPWSVSLRVLGKHCTWRPTPPWSPGVLQAPPRCGKKTFEIWM